MKLKAGVILGNMKIDAGKVDKGGRCTSYLTAYYWGAATLLTELQAQGFLTKGQAVHLGVGFTRSIWEIADQRKKTEAIIALEGMDAFPLWQGVQHVYYDGTFYVNPAHIESIIKEGGILAERLKCGDYRTFDNSEDAPTVEVEASSV